LRIFGRERNRLSRRLSRAESQHDCSWPPGCCSRQGHTLEILQSLGFIYHIDDVSRDGPFLINVRDKPFVVVPYTLHMNDIVDYETQYFSTAMYADGLKAEFEALYAEARTRRRMMSVSAHARIAGRPSRAKVLEEFIIYAQSHPAVAFIRKDEIARSILESPLTVREGI
jgi:peptidoglycan/xylan/chitin deacetylase (PgdA/CDA1 family)